MNIIPSMFTKYALSSEEQTEAAKLTLLQEAKIQNTLAALVEEKVLLPYDVTNNLQSIQREAELQGQIRILQQILTESQVAKAGY